MKPSRAIFDAAWKAAGGARAVRKVYVGDSWETDVLGAKAAGWFPIFFDRHGEGRARAGHLRPPARRPEAAALLSATSSGGTEGGVSVAASRRVFFIAAMIDSFPAGGSEAVVLEDVPEPADDGLGLDRLRQDVRRARTGSRTRSGCGRGATRSGRRAGRSSPAAT